MKEKDESNRRSFLKATGGALIVAGSAGLLESQAQHDAKVAYRVAADDPLGNATVSFGGWMSSFTPPLDRFTNPLPPPPSNHHELIPNPAQIKAGGYVNFIISGLHVVAIYGGGRAAMRPSDIDTTILTPLGPGLPPVIGDPDRRVYRGPNPVISAGPPPVINLDRVEVVHFDNPGTYLVICAVLPHFNEGMFGYVRVLPG